MSGDLIHLLTDSVTSAIDSIKIFDNAIVAEQDSLNPRQFNQMKESTYLVILRTMSYRQLILSKMQKCYIIYMMIPLKT